MPTGSSKRVTPSAPRSWIVATTLWCRSESGFRSITLTLSETWFETQSSPPSGRTARLTGSMPTPISATTAALDVEITLTLLLVVLAT